MIHKNYQQAQEDNFFIKLLALLSELSERSMATGLVTQKYLHHKFMDHSRFNELQRSMSHQADPATSLVAWDRQSAFSEDNVQVARVLLHRIEAYQSCSHQSTLFVSVARGAESSRQRNLPRLVEIQPFSDSSPFIPSFSTPLLSAS